MRIPFLVQRMGITDSKAMFQREEGNKHSAGQPLDLAGRDYGETFATICILTRSQTGRKKTG